MSRRVHRLLPRAEAEDSIGNYCCLRTGSAWCVIVVVAAVVAVSTVAVSALFRGVCKTQRKNGAITTHISTSAVGPYDRTKTSLDAVPSSASAVQNLRGLKYPQIPTIMRHVAAQLTLRLTSNFIILLLYPLIISSKASQMTQQFSSMIACLLYRNPRGPLIFRCAFLTTKAYL